MDVRKVSFVINTVLFAALILYFWFYLLPFFENSAYEGMRNILTIITICLIAAYITSSIVILGKV